MDTTGITINWKPNPLKSEIHLDDFGRLRLRCGVIKDMLESAQATISLELKYAPPSRGGRWVDLYEYNDIEDMDAEIGREVVSCETHLKDTHCGDCTCVPCPCLKCRAEELLGFGVTEGLGKYPGHWIQSTFGKETTLAEAINSLRDSEIKASWGNPKDWEPYMERWKQEKAEALGWLEHYAQEHPELT